MPRTRISGLFWPLRVWGVVAITQVCKPRGDLAGFIRRCALRGVHCIMLPIATLSERTAVQPRAVMFAGVARQGRAVC
jgi:hypothetical protein